MLAFLGFGCATSSPGDLNAREVRIFVAGVETGVDCMADWARDWSLPTPESAALVCRNAAHAVDPSVDNDGSEAK